jgi:hypothetical protein
LNKAGPECARRFDVAHELWHFLCKDEGGRMKEDSGRVTKTEPGSADGVFIVHHSSFIVSKAPL